MTTNYNKKKVYKPTLTGWTNTLQQDISEVIKDRVKEGYECSKELSTGNWVCILKKSNV